MKQSWLQQLPLVRPGQQPKPDPLARDHDGRYFTEAEADERYYNVGEQVADADTLDGLHADEFASAGHDHDDRYMRRVFFQSEVYESGEQKIMVLSNRPDLVTVVYNYLEPGTDTPQATTYVRGAHTDEIRFRVVKTDMGGGDKDYQVVVHNQSLERLYITTAAYQCYS